MRNIRGVKQHMVQQLHAQDGGGRAKPTPCAPTASCSPASLPPCCPWRSATCSDTPTMSSLLDSLSLRLIGLSDPRIASTGAPAGHVCGVAARKRARAGHGPTAPPRDPLLDGVAADDTEPAPGRLVRAPAPQHLSADHVELKSMRCRVLRGLGVGRATSNTSWARPWTWATMHQPGNAHPALLEPAHSSTCATALPTARSAATSLTPHSRYMSRAL